MCVAVERTYVSCLIQFRTFPFVYYKMCKYTLLLGIWCGSCACDCARVRQRLTEWQRKWARQSWCCSGWWCYRYPSFGIRFTCQCYLRFAIFKSNDYSLGSCRCQLGRAGTYCFLPLLLPRPGSSVANSHSTIYAKKSLHTPIFGRKNTRWTLFWLWISSKLKKINCLDCATLTTQSLTTDIRGMYAVIRIRTFAFLGCHF